MTNSTNAQSAVSASSHGAKKNHAWLLILGIALAELIAHFVIQSRVVEPSDWEQAAAVVDAHWEDGDAVIVSPAWADPLLRQYLGHQIGLNEAGRSDYDDVHRLWVLSVRGHRPRDLVPDSAPDFETQTGRIHVLRWSLSARERLYSFTDHLDEARVSMRISGQDRPCTFRRGGIATGGGLGQGAAIPGARHICDPRRSWLWAGVTTMEDLNLQPRRCIWQHPPGPEPMRVTFRDVPLGDELVLFGGLFYLHERERTRGPVEVTVLRDDHVIGQMTHRDGDGWKRMVALTQPQDTQSQTRGSITVEVAAPDPQMRTFCWSGYTRSSNEEYAP